MNQETKNEKAPQMQPFVLKDNARCELNTNELMFLLKYAETLIPHVQFYSLCDHIKQTLISTGQTEPYMDKMPETQGNKGKIVNLQGEELISEPEFNPEEPVADPLQ